MKRMLILFLVVLLSSSCGGGSVLIRSEPPRAYIAINGENKGVTPLKLDLDCDEQKSYDIVAFAPGYQTQQQTISCRWIRGPKNNVFFELEPGVGQPADLVAPPPTPKETYGSLEVKSVPSGAEVFVNGEFFGVTPLKGEMIRPGTYMIEVRKLGFQTEKRNAAVAPESTSSHFVILESE